MHPTSVQGVSHNNRSPRGPDAPNKTGRILIRSPGKIGVPNWLLLDSPETIFRIHRREEVVPALLEIGRATERGYMAAGFISYEAAPAFDCAMRTHEPGTLPLLWFGLYPPVAPVSSFPFKPRAFELSGWKASVSPVAYRSAIHEIKDRIAAGDTYQVNYTFRLDSLFTGDPFSFFNALYRSQQTGYAAWLDTGDHYICSASPELFFRLDGRSITCRPMKGTVTRGLTWQDDEARVERLRHSEKNRAENLMIVDMVRNDLGRVARTGTVRVPRLFEIERYDTLLQMTSTIAAETDAAPVDLFRALFPCASITGAPKIHTMRIIHDLESTPRGIYTGCIGFLGPGRQAQFNVAIRTVHIDRATGRAEYGTGGGIVWDSASEAEFRECEAKTRILHAKRPVFRLLETMLWKPETGYYLLDRHLDRLTESARYFGFRVSSASILSTLNKYTETLPPRPHRVRLHVDENGAVFIESDRLPPRPESGPLRVKPARHPVSSRDRFLYHKTTFRRVYEDARKTREDCDDVLLWNERGEITESTIANVVIGKPGDWVTPPVSCGLLPGTLRAHLLDQGLIRESIVRREDLERAEHIYLVNSVRGWMEAIVVT